MSTFKHPNEIDFTHGKLAIKLSVTSGNPLQNILFTAFCAGAFLLLMTSVFLDPHHGWVGTTHTGLILVCGFSFMTLISILVTMLTLTKDIKRGQALILKNDPAKIKTDYAKYKNSTTIPAIMQKVLYENHITNFEVTNGSGEHRGFVEINIDWKCADTGDTKIELWRYKGAVQDNVTILKNQNTAVRLASERHGQRISLTDPEVDLGDPYRYCAWIETKQFSDLILCFTNRRHIVKQAPTPREEFTQELADKQLQEERDLLRNPPPELVAAEADIGAEMLAEIDEEMTHHGKYETASEALEKKVEQLSLKPDQKLIYLRKKQIELRRRFGLLQ